MGQICTQKGYLDNLVQTLVSIIKRISGHFTLLNAQGPLASMFDKSCLLQIDSELVNPLPDDKF